MSKSINIIRNKIRPRIRAAVVLSAVMSQSAHAEIPTYELEMVDGFLAAFSITSESVINGWKSEGGNKTYDLGQDKNIEFYFDEKLVNIIEVGGDYARGRIDAGPAYDDQDYMVLCQFSTSSCNQLKEEAVTEGGDGSLSKTLNDTGITATTYYTNYSDRDPLYLAFLLPDGKEFRYEGSALSISKHTGVVGLTDGPNPIALAYERDVPIILTIDEENETLVANTLPLMADTSLWMGINNKNQIVTYNKESQQLLLCQYDRNQNLCINGQIPITDTSVPLPSPLARLTDTGQLILSDISFDNEENTTMNDWQMIDIQSGQVIRMDDISHFPAPDQRKVFLQRLNIELIWSGLDKQRALVEAVYPDVVPANPDALDEAAWIALAIEETGKAYDAENISTTVEELVNKRPNKAIVTDITSDGKILVRYHYGSTLVYTPKQIINDIIIDNNDVQNTAQGNWPSHNKIPGYYGEDVQYHFGWGQSNNSFTWNTSIEEAGRYEVQVRWISHAWLSANRAEYKIQHADGMADTEVNQKENSGEWVTLGTYNFDEGNASVSLTDSAIGYIAADAVRFVHSK